MLGGIFCISSGVNQVHEPIFQYAYQQQYLLSRFLLLKIRMVVVEWVAKNIADELNLPGTGGLTGLHSYSLHGSGQGPRRSSHVYEINTWMWNFDRPLPRVGGLSVAKVAAKPSDMSPHCAQGVPETFIHFASVCPKFMMLELQPTIKLDL
jgi:hypothetical protein